MAYRKPSEYEIPINQWSHKLLSQVVGEQGIVDSICPRHVGTILKKIKYDPISQNTGSIQK